MRACCRCRVELFCTQFDRSFDEEDSEKAAAAAPEDNDNYLRYRSAAELPSSLAGQISVFVLHVTVQPARSWLEALRRAAARDDSNF